MEEEAEEKDAETPMLVRLIQLNFENVWTLKTHLVLSYSYNMQFSGETS